MHVAKLAMGRAGKVSVTAGAGPADGTAEVDRSGSGLVAVLVRGPSRVWARNASMKGGPGTGRQGRARSCQGLADEGGGELLEVTAGSVGEFAQGPLPGEDGQPVHRGPYGVLEAGAAPPAEHAGVGQFVEDRAELIQRHGVRPGPAAGSVVGVLPGQGERGGEQPRLLAGELQVRRADRAQPAAGRGWIAVLAPHPADAGGHPG